MQACAADQVACHGFGGSDPWDTYDQLVDSANANPIPATGYGPDPRPIRGDDINFATFVGLYAKENWDPVAEALKEASDGDASFLRFIVDEIAYGRNPDDGTYSPGTDLYFTIGATEQKYPKDPDFYLDRGDEAWATFPHAYFNNGYVELNYGLWPKHDKDAYDGPFRIANSSPTPLVVATTYDPATPYAGALRLVRDLHNARLITMRGDGHTAYGGESACIDNAVNTYLLNGGAAGCGHVLQAGHDVRSRSRPRPGRPRPLPRRCQWPAGGSSRRPPRSAAERLITFSNEGAAQTGRPSHLTISARSAGNGPTCRPASA